MVASIVEEAMMAGAALRNARREQTLLDVLRYHRLTRAQISGHCQDWADEERPLLPLCATSRWPAPSRPAPAADEDEGCRGAPLGQVRFRETAII